MAQTQQPTYGQHYASGSNGEWKNGLFSCCESCSDCCLSWCCPCIYAVISADATGKDELKTWGYITCLTTVLLGTTLPYFVVRSKVREMKGIDGSTIGDMAVVCCCSCCAMVQVKREFED